MKYLRITRIWLAGKYPLIKKMKRYQNRKLFEQLTVITPEYYKAYVEKYADVNWTEFISFLDKNTKPSK